MSGHFAPEWKAWWRDPRRETIGGGRTRLALFSAGVWRSLAHSLKRARKRARDGLHATQNDPTSANGTKENPLANKRFAEGFRQGLRSHMPEVTGSSPVSSTIEFRYLTAGHVAPRPETVREPPSRSPARRATPSRRSRRRTCRRSSS